MRWKPKLRVRATDRGLLWGAFWACLSIATMAFFVNVAGTLVVDRQHEGLEDLILPEATYAVPDDSAGALSEPAPVKAPVTAPAPEPRDDEPVPILPGANLIWLVFGCASVVIWLIILGTPSARGGRYAS